MSDTSRRQVLGGLEINRNTKSSANRPVCFVRTVCRAGDCKKSKGDNNT
jgi:hypothetical protein